MRDTIEIAVGHGNDLNALQMSVRALLVSLICLALLRFSGRRSFALGTPIDNVLAILLGSILSRAVTGASAFIPTLCAAATITVMHRVVLWAGMYNRKLGSIFKGDPKIVYRNGKLYEKNMRYCRVTRRDIMAGVRLSVHRNSLEGIEAIYIERNGRISVIEKTPPHNEENNTGV